MKLLFALPILALSVASCGQPSGDQGAASASSSNRKPVSVSSGGSLDDKKVACVAQGGFLVPANGDFNCRLPNGRETNLWSL